MNTPPAFFIFDVESIGLHGEGFAVAGGVYGVEGNARYEFCFSCPQEEASGTVEDREWIKAHVPVIEITHRHPAAVREAFWTAWMDAKRKYPGILMAGECVWPVEAAFLEACVQQSVAERNWDGPYPLHEIASFMLAAGFDPMASFERQPSELPAHNPLADARLSARLLAESIFTLTE